ncbi:hypothetical protein HDV00_003503 [Rhizophlyctis rosea]|nr:hypothetical protein HDV00_003503 [Rhizophlyctis rosea]
MAPSLLPQRPIGPLLTSLASLLLALGISLVLTWTTPFEPDPKDITTPTLPEPSPAPETQTLCGAAVCSARWFPYPTRLHVIHFYLWIASTGVALYFRDSFRSALDRAVVLKVSKQKRYTFTVGNILMIIWTLFLFANGAGVWWKDMRDVYAARAAGTAAEYGTNRLAIMGLVGHLADLCLGLALLTVARTSLLTTTLNIPGASLLTFHIWSSYTLLLLVLIHMAAFYSWVPIFAGLPDPAKSVFFVDNPTFTEGEVMNNIYRATCLAVGMASFVALIVVAVTSLPYFRTKNYNTFYLFHTVTGLVVVFACIHADTDFYCVLPGLLAWIGDWVWRVRGLRVRRDGVLKHVGKGWYVLDVPVLHDEKEQAEGANAVVVENVSPLCTFYVRIPAISKWEIHPFTTVSDMVALRRDVLDGKKALTVSLVFRPVILMAGGSARKAISVTEGDTSDEKQKKGRAKRKKEEWTVKVANLVPQLETNSLPPPPQPLTSRESTEITISPPCELPTTIPLNICIEGPYISPLHPSPFLHQHLLLIAGGTGITGALSIAKAFLTLRTANPLPSWFRTRKVTLVWTLRACDYVPISSLTDWEDNVDGVDVLVHLTGEGGQSGRVDVKQLVDGTVKGVGGEDVESGVWVYASGPVGLLNGVRDVCVDWNVGAKKLVKKGRIAWYCAHWDI